MVSLDQHKTHLLWDLSGNRLEGIRAKLISKFFVHREKVRAFLALSMGTPGSFSFSYMGHLFNILTHQHLPEQRIWSLCWLSLSHAFFESKLTPQTFIKWRSRTIHEVSCGVLVCQSSLFLMGLAPTSPLHLHHPLCTLSGHVPCLNVTQKNPVLGKKNYPGLQKKSLGHR